MTPPSPILLTPQPVFIESPEFSALTNWPWPSDDEYVRRLLETDIRLRMLFGNCRTWAYRDPSGSLVGLGTLDLSEEYVNFTAGESHPYIPLIAKNPTCSTPGIGKSIMRHLIDESAIMCLRGCHQKLFLDVYTSNIRAISLYLKCGFVQLNSEPYLDSREDDKPYIVMAKNVHVQTPDTANGKLE